MKESCRRPYGSTGLRLLAVVAALVLVPIGTGMGGCEESGAADDAGSIDAVSTEATSFQTSLVQANVWERVPEAEDPWSDADGRIRCGGDAIEVEKTSEGDWLSVNTEACGWVTLKQPLLESVAAGDELLIHVWFFKFVAPKDPTTRYELVLAVDTPDNVVWRREGVVPVESGVFYDIVKAPVALAKGQVVYWHVANHGSNRWEFIRFATL